MTGVTIKTAFNGIDYPFNVYITDNYKFTEDQFRWVEKVRGGKVSQGVEDMFRQMSVVAKNNHLSFREFCIASLGTASLDDKAKQEIGRQKANIDRFKAMLTKASDKERVPLRQRIAAECIRMAKMYFQGRSPMSYNSARETLKEVFTIIEADASGHPRDASDNTVFGEALYVRGLLEDVEGQTERGYRTLLEGLRISRGPGRDVGWSAPGCPRPAFARARRTTEAAFWFWSASEFGKTEGVEQLAALITADPNVTSLLPAPFADELEALNKSIKGPTRDKELRTPWSMRGGNTDPALSRKGHDSIAQRLSFQAQSQQESRGRSANLERPGWLLQPADAGGLGQPGYGLQQIQPMEGIDRRFYQESRSLNWLRDTPSLAPRWNLMEAYLCSDNAEGLLRLHEGAGIQGC